MHSQEILERAREGDPRVIAAILNHVLKPLGVQAQAARREHTLHLVLISASLPDPKRLSSAIQKLIQELHIETLEQIVLYGQRLGEESVAWKQDIVLMTESTVSSMTNPQSNVSETFPETVPEPTFTSPMETTAEGIPTTPPVSVEPPSVMAASAATPPSSVGVEASIVPASEPAIAPPAMEEEDEDTLKALAKALQRPEAVILLFALVLATLWELYLDLAEGDSDEALTGTGLAQRLQVSPSTVSRRKDQDDFSAWSQGLDPEGIAWIYRGGRFWPLESSIVAN